MPVLKDQRREAYCLERVKGKAQHEAYVLAGYKPKTRAVADAAASRLEKDPQIIARIEDLRAQVLPSLNKIRELQAEKAVLDRAWVLNRLMKNAQIAMGELTVKLRLRKPTSRVKSGEGDSPVEAVEVTDRDGQTANKALELLGKTPELGLWIDRVEHGGAGEFARMSDEELQEELQRLANEILGARVSASSSKTH